MHYKTLIPVLFSLSISAFAQPRLQADPGKSYFQQVLEWSNAATPVTFDEVRGAHLGKCFYAIEPNTPMDTTLVADSVSKAGPAFPGKSIFANFRDHLKSASLARSYLLDEEKSLSPAVGEAEGLVTTWDMEPNGRPDMKIILGRYGNYLVVRTVELIGQTYYSYVFNRSFSIAKGQVESACYFYEPLN